MEKTTDIQTDALGAGLIYDLPMERYINDPCPDPSLSKGVIHDLLTKSPAHAKHRHPRLNPDRVRDESSRADIGTAVHSMILGGQEIVFAPEEFMDWRKKDARQFKEDAYANGQTPLLDKQRAGVEASASSARKTIEKLPGFKGDLQTEGTMIWRDGEAWKRGRFDIWVPEFNTMIDVKTVESADPETWIRTALIGGGYDIQAEHYLDGIRAVGKGDKNTEFLFLLVEYKPPYCCSVVGLDQAFSAVARRKVGLGT